MFLSLKITIADILSQFYLPKLLQQVSTMANYIAVITQEELEPQILPNANPTMAIPSLEPLLIPQFPKKKMLQKTLNGGVAPASPKTKKVAVPAHMRGTRNVKFHMRTVKVKPTGNKKESKKQKGKSKQSTNPWVKDDCKESVQLAKTLHIQELRDLVNSFKK
jgi:hypothetical protein